MINLPFDKGTVKVSSPYGYRILWGNPDWHKGIDLVGIDSKNIISPVDGKVVQSRRVYDTTNRTSEWGNYICIQTDKYQFYFCHLSCRLVEIGATVKAGDIIGIEGGTGVTDNAYGSHLHFEMKDVSGTSIDPTPFLGIPNKDEMYYEVNSKPKSKSEELAEKNGVSEYAKKAVVWALDSGVMFGDGNGNLMLKEPCTREQMITFIYRAIISDDYK